MVQENLRSLPSVDQVLSSLTITALVDEYGHKAVVDAARSVIQSIRTEIRETGKIDKTSVDAIGRQVVSLLERRFAPSLRYAVNATGIILHTGLGRAMLPEAAVERIHDTIKGYSTLAVDPETGQRGSRDVHVSGLICELTGAEAATVVNNNAAATMIVLNSLAKGKEVILSRGQLVEIGGSFRMPDVMEASGAVLREVGTTNKTHLRDYVNAIGDNTGAIMRVHTSNYRIVGFSEEPPIEDLVRIGREHNIPVIDDLGSGALVDLARYGLEPEPLVKKSIESGVDAACFSGDKLIGGPQCGIIVGRADAIGKIKKNPLARALRVGKMTVAGLEGTLTLFHNMEKLEERHPTYRMLSLTVDALAKIAEPICCRLSTALTGLAEVTVVDGCSQVGSGSVPTETLPSRLLSVKPLVISADAVARRLRHGSPPIFGRINRDAVLFDLRTIQPGEESLIESALETILREGKRS